MISIHWAWRHVVVVPDRKIPKAESGGKWGSRQELEGGELPGGSQKVLFHVSQNNETKVLRTHYMPSVS